MPKLKLTLIEVDGDGPEVEELLQQVRVLIGAHAPQHPPATPREPETAPPDVPGQKWQTPVEVALEALRKGPKTARQVAEAIRAAGRTQFTVKQASALLVHQQSRGRCECRDRVWYAK